MDRCGGGTHGPLQGRGRRPKNAESAGGFRASLTPELAQRQAQSGSRLLLGDAKRLTWTLASSIELT